MSATYGEHRVVRELARGGMGVLYEVEHVPTGARRALKTLLLGAHDPEERARFRREAQLLARLDHPAIVRIHEAVVDGPTPYLVQDLLPGGSLEARLAKGPLPCDEARAIAAALARGVEHAHARGVLHRDLKPRNVVFDDQGRPRLVDFGLARRVDGGSLTATGTILGTPGYLPPEQALGLPADERSDVYGLGAVLYALLVGGPPHQGQHAMAVLAAVVEGRFDPPRALRPDLPPDLEAICLRALATDPAARFPTAAALAAALEGHAPAELGPSRAVPWLVLTTGLLVAGATALAATLRRDALPSPPPHAPTEPPATTAPVPSPTTVAAVPSAVLDALVRSDAGGVATALDAALERAGEPPPDREGLRLLARAIDAGAVTDPLRLGASTDRVVRALAPLERTARRFEAMADGAGLRPLTPDPTGPLLELAEAALGALHAFEEIRTDEGSGWRQALRRRAQRTIGRALSAQGLASSRHQRDELLAWQPGALDLERDHTDVLWAYQADQGRRTLILDRLRPVYPRLASIHRRAAQVVLLALREPIFSPAEGDEVLVSYETLALDGGSRMTVVRREVGRLHRLAAWRLRRELPRGAKEPAQVALELTTATTLCTKQHEEAGGHEGAELLLCLLARPDLKAARELFERLHDVDARVRGLLGAELLLAEREWEQALDALQAMKDDCQERRAQLAHALKRTGDPAWEAPLEGAERLQVWGIEWRGLDVARQVANDEVWWPGRTGP